MSGTELSIRELTRNVSRAKRPPDKGPAVITDRGERGVDVFKVAHRRGVYR